MPKYYRFRTTTPTRSARQATDKYMAKEEHKTETLERAAEGLMGLGLTLVCAAPPWYRRRTAWRERTSAMGPMRQLTTIAGRPVFAVNLRSSEFTF